MIPNYNKCFELTITQKIEEPLQRLVYIYMCVCVCVVVYKISNFFTMNDRLDDELNNPVPLQLEPVPLPRDVLCTFPTVGTVLRVIFDQGMQKHLLRFLHTGKWVKFVNIYTLRSVFRIMAWCLDAFHKASIYAK